MTRGTPGSVPLFLCCAEDTEVYLVKVVDALHKEGMAPEVVAGVETDPSLLGNVVDRANGPALFVLCQSEELDKFQTRRLAGLFSARKGPGQKIITVQLHEGRPLSILQPIRSGMKDIVGDKRRRGASDAGERVNLREVVGPMAMSALPRDDQLPDLEGIDDAEALARELHEEMLAAEAILTKREDARREDTGRGRARSERPPVELSANDSGAPSIPVAAAPVAPPAPAPGTEPGAPTAPLDSAAVDAGPLGDVSFTGDSSDDLAAETAPDGLSGDTGPQHSASTTREAVRGRSRLTFLVAAAGVAGLGMIATLYLREGLESERGAPRGMPDEPAVHAGAADAESATPKTPPPEATAPTDVEPEPEGAPPPGEPRPSPTTPNEPPKGRPSAPPPPPPTDPEALAINGAIAQGRMRALDAILMLPATTDTMTWDLARDHCRSERVSGVGGWRLPSKSELRRLRRARLLSAGSYWTRHKGEADDEAVAYDARTGRWVVWLTIEPNARAFCVRPR